MHEFHGRASTHVDAPPAAVFDLITDVGRLPEWNAAIEALVAKPPALVPGAEWTVTVNPPGIPPWNSISRVEEIDPQNGRFAYETRNADGNPSYVKWVWQIAGASTGAEVKVTWDCYLKTLDRRILAGPVRKHQLAREVPRSLAALASAVRVRTGSAS
jgi:Polyketide cyclase / dehydrase and lipid transport